MKKICSVLYNYFISGQYTSPSIIWVHSCKHSHWNFIVNCDKRQHKLKNITFSSFTFLSIDTCVTGHCVDRPESLFRVRSKYLHLTHSAFRWTYPAWLHLTWIWTLETFCPFKATYYTVKQKKTLLFTYNTDSTVVLSQNTCWPWP